MRAFLLLFGLCGLLGFLAVGRMPRPAPDERLYAGRIEADALLLGFEPAGTLATLSVAEGDWVSSGATIATLDARELEAARARAAAVLERSRAREESAGASLELARSAWRRDVEQSQAALARASETARLVELGPRREAVQRAEAALAQSKALLEEASREVARTEQLSRTNAVPEQQVDRARTEHAVRKQALASAQAALDEARHGSRPQEIAAARAEVDRLKAALELARAGETRARVAELELAAARKEVAAARADLELAQERHRKASLQAPRDGVVDEVLRRPGEVVKPGEAIVRLLDAGRPYLKAYLPSSALDRVQPGAKMRVLAGVPQRFYEGRVEKVARRAEFTPKDVQTRERRLSLVYEVKIGIADPKRELLAGQPADLELEG